MAAMQGQNEAKGPGHTPGPWVNEEPAWGDIDGPDGVCIALVIDQADKGKHAILLGNGGAFGPPIKQAKANARLIASAPELLEAGRAILNYAAMDEWLDKPGGDAEAWGVRKGDLRKLRAAIAKATGK